MGRSIALLVAYVLGLTWLTWPFAASLATRLPAAGWLVRFDRYYSIWALAWGSRALATAPLDLPNANIYWPTRDALFYGPAGFGALPYFAPVFLATGNPVLAANLTLLGCLSLTAWTMHLVGRRWTGSGLAGFVAACTILTNRWLLWFPATAPNYAALHLFPLIAFTAAAPLRRLGPTLRLGSMLALQCLTDLVYVGPAALVPVGVLAAWRTARRGTRAAGVRLLAAIAVGAALLVPVAAGYLRVAARNPELRTQTSWSNPEVPVNLPRSVFDLDRPAAMLPATAVLIAAGAGATLFGRRPASSGLRRAWSAGWLWALVGWYISLTPVVSVGYSPLSLPQAALAAWFPLLTRIRVPSRLGIAGLMGIAILSGAAFAAIEEWLSRKVTAPVLARLARGGLAFVVAWGLFANSCGSGLGSAGWRTAPPPTTPRSFVHAIGTSPGPLVEVPLAGWTRSGSRPVWSIYAQAEAEFHSIEHRAPILNGYSSYYPREFPERMELAAQLPHPVALGALRKSTGLRYVWVHLDRLPRKAQLSWSEAAARPTNGLTLVAREGQQLLFRMR